MLLKIRDRVQGVLTWGIIVVIGLSFAMFGLGRMRVGPQESELAATVNGEEISKREVELNVQHILAQLDPSAKSNSAFVQKLREQTTEHLLQERSQVLFLKDLGLRAPETTILDNIRKTFSRENVFSETLYREQIARAGFTDAQYRATVNDSMVSHQFQAAVLASAFLLPEELSEKVALNEESRDFGYVRIPHSRFENEVTVSEKEITEFFESNKENYQWPLRVSLAYVILKQKSDQQENDFLDDIEELSNMAYENSDNLESIAKSFGVSIQKTVLFDREGLKQGIASNDKIVSRAFDEELMTEGHNSEPIQLDEKTYVVFRIDKQESPREMTLAEAKTQINKKLRLEKAKEKAFVFAQELANNLRQGQESPESVAKKQKLNWILKIMAVRYEHDLDPVIKEKAFGLILPSGKATKPVVVFDGKDEETIVLQLSKVKLGAFSTLDPVLQRQYEQALVKQAGSFAFQVHLDALISNAKIERLSWH